MYCILKKECFMSNKKNILTRVLGALTFVLFSCVFGYSQTGCNQQSLIIKSGINSATSAYLTIGDFDYNWTIVQDGLINTSEPRPAVAYEKSNGWISYVLPTTPVGNDWSCQSYKTTCSPTSLSSCSSWAGFPSPPTGLGTDLPIIANYSFCINSSADLNAVLFNFGILADDYAKVCINGIYVGNSANGRSSLANFSVSNTSSPGLFHAGTNVISVSFYNLGGGPVFFKFEGTLTSTISNSNAFSYYSCCIATGNITGQKFLDVNKNGIKDIGESGIENWTIILKDENGNFIDSTQTDNSGNYYFVSLPTSTYIVEEVPKVGFYQTFPSTVNYNVSLGAGQYIPNLDFGNAIDETPRCSNVNIQIPEGTFCFNNSVGMSVIGCPNTSAIYNYNWSFGDGLTSSGASVSHTYQYPGSYSISLTVVQAGQADIVVTKNILIEDCVIADCKDCIDSFQPSAGKYILSAWVKEDLATGAQLPKTYSGAKIQISFYGVPVGTDPIVIGTDGTKNKIIDGWQRIEQEFTIPPTAAHLLLKLNNTGTQNAYYDDIRIFPIDGQMKTYVYDPITLRLTATLDENNYATFYEYDEEGKLIRVKKETEKGIMTIQESREGTKKK